MDETQLQGANPVHLFQDWMREAEATELNDPNAVALATASAAGVPSVRMVLLKGVAETGFSFFTNEESEKGVQLAENPRAAMCFHWKSLRRQVRLEGTVSQLADTEVDDYFHSRSRRSQLGAAVSQQSRPLSSRATLEAQVQAFGVQHPDEVPRPEYWRGYTLQPLQMEFWMDGPDRLHDRFLFTRVEAAWAVQRLYP